AAPLSLASGSESSTSRAIASRSSLRTSFRRRSRSLPCRLLTNEGVHSVFEDGQRHRAERENCVVESALVELRPERRLGLLAQLEDGQLAELVGERLSRPADVAVDLGLHLMLRQCRVA